MIVDESHKIPFSVNIPLKQRIPLHSTLGMSYAATAVALVIFSGIASGLTVGLMSLDPVHLKVLEVVGSENQKRRLRVLYNLIRKHHLLLVTLLIANATAMETLPIFLDRLAPSWMAVLISVTAILLFGEIIPHAVCTGRHQLFIAQTVAPLVHALICVFFIVSYPIAKFLDYTIGNSDQSFHYARPHLKALIRMHERERRIKMCSNETESNNSDISSALGADEVNVIEGALDLAGKRLHQIMVPLNKVFMLEENTIMNKETFDLILHMGHSRIPVYSENVHNVKGLILTKYLLAVDPHENIRAKDIIVRRRPIFSHPSRDLYDLLNEFQKGHTHIAFVTEYPEEHSRCLREGLVVSPDFPLLGIATLEDIIEELIQEEIYDEFDKKMETDFIKAVDEAYKEVEADTDMSWKNERSHKKTLAKTFSKDYLNFTSNKLGALPQIVQEVQAAHNKKHYEDNQNVEIFSPFKADMTISLLPSKKLSSRTSTDLQYSRYTYSATKKHKRSHSFQATTPLRAKKVDLRQNKQSAKEYKPMFKQGKRAAHFKSKWSRQSSQQDLFGLSHPLLQSTYCDTEAFTTTSFNKYVTQTSDRLSQLTSNTIADKLSMNQQQCNEKKIVSN